MLLALRSLFETETVYIAPAGKARKRIAFHPVYSHDAKVVLEPLNVFPVVGRIQAKGSAKQILETCQARFEIGLLEIRASAAATVSGQNILQSELLPMQLTGQDDDEEALKVILDSI